MNYESLSPEDLSDHPWKMTARMIQDRVEEKGRKSCSLPSILVLDASRLGEAGRMPPGIRRLSDLFGETPVEPWTTEFQSMLDECELGQLDGVLMVRSDLQSQVIQPLCWRGETLPDHVVVEAGSSASLVRMSGYSFLPGLRPGGLISVVSAPEVAKLREDGAEPDSALEAQLQQAELVVLNHTDGVKAVMRPIIRRWLQQRTARARVIESEKSCVPAAMILGASLAKAPVHAIHGEWSPGFSIETESRRNRVLQPRHPEDYRAWAESE